VSHDRQHSGFGRPPQPRHAGPADAAPGIAADAAPGIAADAAPGIAADAPPGIAAGEVAAGGVVAGGVARGRARVVPAGAHQVEVWRVGGARAEAELVKVVQVPEWPALGWSVAMRGDDVPAGTRSAKVWRVEAWRSGKRAETEPDAVGADDSGRFGAAAIGTAPPVSSATSAGAGGGKVSWAEANRALTRATRTAAATRKATATREATATRAAATRAAAAWAAGQTHPTGATRPGGARRPTKAHRPAAVAVTTATTGETGPVGETAPADAAAPRNRHWNPRRGADSHRKPRRVWRGLEVAAWVGCLGIIVAVVAVVVSAATPPDQRTQAPAAAVAPSATCAVGACKSPAPVTVRPTRVRIPKIDVDSPLELLQLDPRTEVLIPPVSYQKAGWYGGSALPGDPGASVIAGHVDSRAGAGVFYNLHRLKPGDKVLIQRGGQWFTYRVTRKDQYAKDHFPSEKVYDTTPNPELRLITCGGSFDRSRSSYSDNIVVYAVIDRSTPSPSVPPARQ